MTQVTTRHDLRCPNCQRFIENEPDGFYDRLGNRDDETSWVAPFCNERCADHYHEQREAGRSAEADSSSPVAADQVRIPVPVQRALLPPFNMHQEVWYIQQGRKAITEACEFCAGVGRIDGANGKDAACPECYGRKSFTKSYEDEWQIVQSLTIGQIRVEWTGYHDGGGSIFSNYGDQEEKVEWSFMAYETGIGSGNVYRAPMLFASREEAQATCDARNAELVGGAS